MSGSREASVQWKPEWDEALKQHFAAGLSGSVTATKLNAEFSTAFTRSAVGGRAKRLKVPRKASQSVLNARAGKKSLLPKTSAILGAPPKFKRGRKPNTTPPQRPDIGIRKAASAPKLGTVAFKPRPDPRPGAVPLLDLAPDGCKWPSGEGPYLFCNEPRFEARPYCAAHVCLAYSAPEPRRQRQ